MDQPVLDHQGPWTERDYLALVLPATARVELIEGTLAVGPGPAPEHEKAVAVVRAALAASLPPGLRVLGPVRLRLGTDCVVVPDLVVARAPATTSGGAVPADEVLDSADPLMVVDVVGRVHGIAQRSFKPQLYARSRIPYAVLVDSDASSGVANMIIGGRYHEFARAGAGEQLVLDEPFRIELDLAAIKT